MADEMGDDLAAVTDLVERLAGEGRAKKLSIARIERVGPVQVSLTSRFEVRGVRMKVEGPSRDAVTRGPPRIDPWEVDISVEIDVDKGVESRVVMDAHRRIARCEVCDEQGRTLCETCEGRGTRAVEPAATCLECEGSRYAPCRTCDGSRAVAVVPIAWATIDEHVDARTLGVEALPVDTVLDLAELDGSGKILVHEEGERIATLRGGYGYRDAARVDELGRAVEALCRQPGVPDGARIRRQVLEVREVPVYLVHLTGGTKFHVWGEPPMVAPRHALDRLPPWVSGMTRTTGSTVALASATIVGLASAVAYLLLQ